jgi:hypothetical protein
MRQLPLLEKEGATYLKGILGREEENSTPTNLDLTEVV